MIKFFCFMDFSLKVVTWQAGRKIIKITTFDLRSMKQTVTEAVETIILSTFFQQHAVSCR